MGIFSRKKDTSYNDDDYNADEIFEKHYTSFAESVRGEIIIGAQDTKQITYTLHDGTVFIVRTVGENIVFAAPQENVNLAWVADVSSVVSHAGFPVLNAIKSAESLIEDFSAFDYSDTSSHRTAQILSSFTFNTIRHLDSVYDQVFRVRSSFLMYHNEVMETQQLSAIGELPVDYVQEALDAVRESEVGMLESFGFDTNEALHGEITVVDQNTLHVLDDESNAVEIVVRGLLAEQPTMSLPELQDITGTLLWRDVLEAVEKLFLADVVHVSGGSIELGLPDMDDQFTKTFDPSDLAKDVEVVQGEVVTRDDVDDDITEDVRALEGMIVPDEDFAFEIDDDGDFEYEEMLDSDYGFTTDGLDDSVLTHDAQRVMRLSDVSERVYERASRFLSENDRLERELSSLEETVEETRARLKSQKETYGDLAIERELHGADDAMQKQLYAVKDDVHRIYFKLAEKEEERTRLNDSRYEVLSEVHSIFDDLHSDGVQDILNRIEHKMEGTQRASNVAYQTEQEEAEEVVASTRNVLSHQNLLGTPLFDRLMQQRTLKL